MHRFKITALLLAITLLLAACSSTAAPPGSEAERSDRRAERAERRAEPPESSRTIRGLGDEGDIANTKFEEVLATIKNKDRENLKSIFSKNALAEAADIDAEVDRLFALIQGDIVSWEDDKWSSDESVRSGKVSRMIRSWFIVTTTEDTYLFFMLDYDKDQIDPDNQGLYSLRAIHEEDRATHFTYWQDMEIPGIYVPAG